MTQTRPNRILTRAAPAKLNLFLEVGQKRSDGFHQIETVMAPVSLADTLTIEPAETTGIELMVVGGELAKGVPVDERNLVVKAAELMRDAMGQRGQPHGVRIHLEKRIPSEAGLGGASSDAAAALVLLNRTWNADLPFDELLELAAELGSDVPFFLQSGWAVATGRGEIIQPIDGPSGIPVVIAKPSQGLKTADVYRQHKAPDNPKNLTDFVEAVRSGRIQSIGACLFNRLQAPAMSIAPELTRIREAFANMPCLGHQMTGSGSAYFGLFATRKVAKWAAACLSNRLPHVTIFSGCISGANGKPC